MRSPELISAMRPKASPEVFEYEFESSPLPSEAITILRHYCIVAPLKAKEKTSGGIILPDQSRQVEEYLAQYGKLEAIGELFYKTGALADCVNVPKIGDYVQFKPYTGRRWDCKEKGEKDFRPFLIMQDSDIIGVVNPAVIEYKIYA